MSRHGPASRRAIDPTALVAYVDSKSSYQVEGIPKRKRLAVNGLAISETDARMVRRWRTGNIEGITINSARSLLHRYKLNLTGFSFFCGQTGIAPTLRGKLPADD